MIFLPGEEFEAGYLVHQVAPNEIFNGIATGLLGSLGYSSLLGASSHVSEDGPVIHPDEEVLELSELCPTSPPTIGGDFQASVMTNMMEVLEETQKNKGLPLPSSGKNMKQVNRFDMVNDCLDNHFVDGAGKGLPSSQVKRGWMKKIQHEWSILEKDLPETIFVRAYEDTLVDDVESQDLEKIESVVLNSIESHAESKNLEKNDSAAQDENQEVAYTFDTGPNAVLIARNRKTAALLLQRLLFYFPPQSDTNLDRYQASKDDITVHAAFAKAPSSEYVNVSRW